MVNFSRYNLVMWEIVYKSYSWRFANVRKLENELFKGH